MCHFNFATVIFLIFQVSASQSSNDGKAITVTRKLPSYFKDDLIKVELYHAVTVQQEHRVVDPKDIANECKKSIQSVNDKVIDVIGDPIAFADLFNNAFPGLLNFAQEINRTELIFSFEASMGNNFTNNRLLSEFAHKPIELQETFLSNVSFIDLFKLGILTTSLRAKLFLLYQCIQITTVLQGDVINDSMRNAIAMLNTTLETDSLNFYKELQPKVKIVEKVSTESNRSRFLRSIFIPKTDSINSCETASCSSLRKVDQRFCDRDVYHCVESNYTKLEVMDAGINSETSYDYVLYNNRKLYGSKPEANEEDAGTFLKVFIHIRESK